MYSAKDIKELRERTGAGMLDCKKALEENNGNMDSAIDWLREKGISKAAKKESRIAAEGVSATLINNDVCVLLEVNCETDFVAKNEEFKSFINYLLTIIAENNINTVEELLKVSENGETVEQKLVALVAKIGEKISIRRFERLVKKANEVFGSYIHLGGKIASVVVLKGNNEIVAKDVAMHVAAMNPQFLSSETVSEEARNKEAKIITEQTMNEGKPKEIAEKMVQGRMKKFYKEVCLLEQAFIKEPDIDVLTYTKNNNSKVLAMYRYEVGEGLEKRNDNFAEEVMNQMKGN